MTVVTIADSLPRPIVVHRAVRLAVDADKMWAFIGDVGNTEIGKGMVDRVETTGTGLGAIRTLHLPGGIGAVVERVEEYNAKDRYYVYRVIDSGPVDLINHLGLIKVQPAGAGSCIISWTSTGQAVDGAEEQIRAILSGNLDLVFAAIRRYFGLA